MAELTGNSGLCFLNHSTASVQLRKYKKNWDQRHCKLSSLLTNLDEKKENHKCFKDSIWLLPDGRFLQRIYSRKGTLIYEEESRWHLYPDRLRIDCISALPPECEKVDTLYPLELEGGGADLEFYRKKDTFAIYIPVYHELEIGFYFYKVESGKK